MFRYVSHLRQLKVVNKKTVEIITALNSIHNYSCRVMHDLLVSASVRLKG